MKSRQGCCLKLGRVGGKAEERKARLLRAMQVIRIWVLRPEPFESFRQYNGLDWFSKNTNFNIWSWPVLAVAVKRLL